MKNKLITVSDVNSIVGECPLWDKKNNTFMFLDIRGKCIWCQVSENGWFNKINLPQEVGTMAICENGDLLLAMQDGIYRTSDGLNFKKAHQDIKIKGRRFNDGKIGPDGAFYLGTTDNDGNGAFYKLSDGVLTEIFDGCFCSNGIEWTSDNTKMYYIDSLKYMIEIFDFDINQGTLKNRQKFMDIPKELGLGDGMTLDENGDLYVALWSGSKVIKIDKNTKKITDEIILPCPKVSSCFFGGEKLNELYITTASFENQNEYEKAGHTFKVKLNVKGKSINYYKDNEVK